MKVFMDTSGRYYKALERKGSSDLEVTSPHPELVNHLPDNSNPVPVNVVEDVFKNVAGAGGFEVVKKSEASEVSAKLESSNNE